MQVDAPSSPPPVTPSSGPPPDAVQPGRIFAPAADAPAAAAPVLAFRVGVSGHRADQLAGVDENVLRTRVREVLQWVRETVSDIGALHEAPYAEGGPVLRVISPLAEGADRIVAREAQALGYRLQAPIPFPRDEYAKDFASKASKEEFARMLKDASAVLELDGVRGSDEERNAAYEAAGRTVLRQSDLLIAIWNGADERGQGGTGQIVREAAALQIPVVWIHASKPGHDIEYRVARDWSVDRQLMRERIQQMLVLHDGAERDKVAAYLGEKPWWRIIEPVFGLVLRLWTGSSHRRRRPGVKLTYGPDYERADRLAQRYGDRYRSSYTLNFCLAPLAVLAGVLGYYAAARGFHGPVAALAELAIISSILLITWLGHRFRWHEKWLDYRLLAELFRQHAVLEPLGRVPPSFRVAAHARAGDPSRGWVHWLHRARVREKGMAGGVLNPHARRLRRAELRALVKEQERYHAGNSHRLEKLSHRVHLTGLILFGCTALACIGHLLLPVLVPAGHGTVAHGPALPGLTESALTFVGIMFPAWGAALAGFRSHGEFNRIAQRSHAMAARMRELRHALVGIRRSTTSTTLGQRAEEVAETMVDELLDWRIIFREKPIAIPS